MICIFLLVSENIPHVVVAAHRKRKLAYARIERHSIHAFNSREIGHLFPGARIHGNHLWGRSCPNKQPVRFFVEGPVAIPLARLAR